MPRRSKKKSPMEADRPGTKDCEEAIPRMELDPHPSPARVGSRHWRDFLPYNLMTRPSGASIPQVAFRVSTTRGAISTIRR